MHILMLGRQILTICASGVLFVAVFYSTVGQLHSQNSVILIDDSDLDASQIVGKDSLRGLRVASPEFFSTAEYQKEKVGLPTEVFIKAAQGTPALRDSIHASSGNKPSKFSEWYDASKAVAWQQNLRKTPIVMHFVAQNSDVQLDSAWTAGFHDTELITSQRPKVYLSQHGGRNTEFFEVDGKAFGALRESYMDWDAAAKLPPTEAHKRLTSAQARLVSYPLLASVAEITAGEVSFGRSLAYPASEKKLVIPPSIATRSKVYWVEFAVSLRELNTQNLDKVTFTVMGPKDVIATELVPLKYEKETDVNRTVAVPEIKVDAASKVGIEIGKVFEQTVAYKTLTPTIVAEGLQESEFGWTMLGDAIQPGAKRFIAILVMPKARASATMQLRLTAKTKASWRVQSNLAATKTILDELILP